MNEVVDMTLLVRTLLDGSVDLERSRARLEASTRVRSAMLLIAMIALATGIALSTVLPNPLNEGSPFHPLRSTAIIFPSLGITFLCFFWRIRAGHQAHLERQRLTALSLELQALIDRASRDLQNHVMFALSQSSDAPLRFAIRNAEITMNRASSHFRFSQGRIQE